MAVVGPHAMGLWQIAADERLPTTHRNLIHAVRLRSGEGKLPTYSKVFSTGCQTLDDRLRKLVEELLTHEREGRRLWKRGEKLTLRDNRGRDSTWTVWDAGYVDN